MGIGPETLKNRIKPSGHLIASRKKEILIGSVLFVLGCLFLWDAFDGRNRKLPWPFSGLAPW